MHPPVVGDVGVEHGHLPAADAGADVRHAVVVADLLVLVIGERLAGLRGEEHRPASGLVVGDDQRTAARGGNHLVAVERQRTQCPERAALAPLELRAKGLGGILQHRDSIPFGHAADGVDIGRMP